MTKRSAGRPPFKVTPTLRRKVAISAGAGMSHENIALALGISRPTLEKHFEVELSIGAHQKRMEIVEALHRAGRKGSVAAAKAFLALEPKVAPPPFEPRPEKAEGKKAQANADAVTAHEGTEWAELLKPSPSVQ